MSAFGRVRSWTRAVILRDRAEREMRDEMREHIAQATERFRARGMSDADARAAARREFGNVPSLEEHSRDARGGASLDSFAGDVKYALRYFARTPLTTITIVLTLTVGIGLSSAMFSVLSTVLTRPAPLVPHDRAIVRIRAIFPPDDDHWMSFGEVETYAALRGEIEQVAAWLATDVAVDDGRTDRNTTREQAAVVTLNYFSFLRLSSSAGRFFERSASSAERTPVFEAVVSYAFAKQHYGEPSGAVGRPLQVNDITYSVVGVAPEKFVGVVPGDDAPGVWVPVSSLQSLWGARDNPMTDPRVAGFSALARLNPGVSREDAAASVRLAAAQVVHARLGPTGSPLVGTADLLPLRGLLDSSITRSEAFSIIGMVATLAVFILLMCTTTVGSLLAGAGITRRYEIGVRLALGAARARVVRQLLTETAILAFASAALGLALFYVIARAVENMGVGFDLVPDWKTISFSIVCALAAAMLSGLTPALHATRAGVSDVLKNGARGATRRSRLQRGFVAAQIAVSMPLLAAIGGMIEDAVRHLPARYDASIEGRVLRVGFATDITRSENAPARIPDLAREVAGVPGVLQVVQMGSSTRYLTLDDGGRTTPTDTIRARRTSAVVLTDVAPGYFAVLGIPIVHGRDFVPADTLASTLPIVLDEHSSRALFGNENPLGQRVFQPANGDERPIAMEVIGITHAERAGERRPAFTLLRGGNQGGLLVQTAGPAEQVIPSVLSIGRTTVRGLPITYIKTLASSERDRLENERQAILGGAGAGSLALLLASVGLFAIVSVSVGQRLREIGVRLALGAGGRRVVAGFVVEGLRTAAIGIAIGIPLGYMSLKVLLATAGVRATNTPLILILIALVVTSVSALASWLPARRAAGVDPMSALRVE